MKKLFLILLHILCCFPAFAQRGVLANAKQNIAYIGVPNPMDFAVEGRYCKDLLLSTDNGKLTQDEENPCSYSYYPEKQGKAELIISERKNPDKVLGRAIFRIKLIPDPIAMVGGKNGGEIRKQVLVALPGIYTMLAGFDFDVRFQVLGFTATLYRKNEVLYSQTCTGPLFPPELTKAFGMLQPYDKVMFSEMSYRAPDNRKGTLLPIEFRIVE